MKIIEEFIRGNKRVEIISNNGVPTPIPVEWQPVLGEGCDMLVVIPDMHMYEFEHQMDNFKFGAEALRSLLEHVNRLKNSLEDQGNMLELCQIGDMYEFLFSGQHGNSTVSEISQSNDNYSFILNMFDTLNTIKIYGNHDFFNWHFSGYTFNYLLGKTYIEHGFAGDIWVANPDNPLWKPLMLLFLGINDLKSFIGNILEKGGILWSDQFFSPGVNSGSIPRGGITNDDTYLHECGSIKDYYCKRLINHSNGNDCKISIIGHTHNPYIDNNVDSGNYIYIDVGAWTEGRSDFVVATNEEIAICRYKRISEI